MDTTPRPEQILSDSAWLDRVARGLVRDPATVEDLVQEAWIAALRRKARGKEVGRGWLRRTLLSRLWNRRREDSNRRARERSHARGELTPSTDELIERAELQRRIATELTRLPEPERTTVLLRFLEGLSPAEIARRMGVAPDTVRKRLRRSAERLRERLAEENLGGYGGAFPPLVEALLGDAPSTMSSAFSAVGGLLVMKKVIAALVVAVLLALGVGWWRNSELPTPGVADGVAQSDSGPLAILPDSRKENEGPESPVLPQVREILGERQLVLDERQRADPGDLVVLLRNHAGRPVDGHPLRVGLGGRAWNEYDEQYLYEKTDAHGRLVVAREKLTEILAQRPGGSLRIEVGTRLPGGTVSCSFPCDRIPDEPVVLRADLGRLVVRGRCPDGSTWTGRGGVSVRPEGLHYFSNGGPFPRVAWVPIGVPYELRLYGCGVFREGTGSFAALEDRDRDRLHELQLGAAYPALRGVLSYEDGQLVAEGTWIPVLDRGHSGGWNTGTRVREGGVIEFPLVSMEGATGTSRTFVITSGRTASPRYLEAEATVEIPPDGATTDLGQLVLRRPPVLFSGRVTVPEGHSPRGVGIDVRVPGIEGIWHRHPGLHDSGVTDGDGLFTLYGTDRPGPRRLQVRLSSRDDLEACVPACALELGDQTTDLLIPLVWPGALEAQLDLEDPAVPRSAAVNLHVSPDAGGDELLVRQGIRPGSSGKLLIKGIPPGLARLELLSEIGSAPIGRVEGIAIVAGETTGVGVIRPAAEARQLRLTLRDRNGELVKDRASVVRYGLASSAELSYSVHVRGGIAILPTPVLPIDLVISCAGYRSQVHREVAGDLELALDSRPVVQFAWMGMDRLLADQDRNRVDPLLVVAIEPVEPSRDPLLRAAAELAPPLHRMLRLSDGPPWLSESSVQLDGPGRYRIRLQLVSWEDRVQGRLEWRSSNAWTEGGRLEVLDSAEPQRVEIPLPARF